MSLFGPLIHGGQVETAVIDTLKLWVPTYLREAERQHGREQESIPSPRSYVTVPDREEPNRWPAEQLPAVVVMSPGFAEPPARTGTSFRARWAVGIAVVVSASTEVATRDLAHLYGVSCAAAVTQRASLGGFALGTSWEDLQYDRMDSDRRRTLAYVITAHTVDVDDVLDVMGGPTEPDPTPSPVSPEWPTVETTDLMLQAIGADEPLPDLEEE